MKRSPWFKMNTPPVRVGEYEVSLDHENGYPRIIDRWRWDGEAWVSLSTGLPVMVLPADRWRGVLK